MGRLSVSLLLGGVLVGLSGTARAADPADADDPVEAPPPVSRAPTRHVAIEVNPLAPVAGLFGGQVEAVAFGPITLQVGASYLHLGDTRECSSGTRENSEGAGCSGGSGVDGLVTEVGPRFWFPLTKRSVGPMLWLGPAWGHDWAWVDRAGTTRERFERNRVIVDVGVRIPLLGPFYVATGGGIMKAVDDPTDELAPSSRSLGDQFGQTLLPSTYVRSGTGLRLLLMFGVAL